MTSHIFTLRWPITRGNSSIMEKRACIQFDLGYIIKSQAVQGTVYELTTGITLLMGYKQRREEMKHNKYCQFELKLERHMLKEKSRDGNRNRITELYIRHFLLVPSHTL
jgi:hypothetical protein